MPRDERKRQQAQQRRAAKRNRRKHALARAASPSPRRALRAAAGWPLHECLVSADWRREGEVVQVAVARRSPAGQIAAGLFLVDLCCLGVKDAFASFFESEAEYEGTLRRGLTGLQRLVRVDPSLGARIVREGIAYAHRLGFSPHRDYAEAAVLLQGIDPDASDARIPLGLNGRPCFIAGPHDDVPRILARLERAVGTGNFNYVVGMAAAPGFFGDEDEA